MNNKNLNKIIVIRDTEVKCSERENYVWKQDNLGSNSMTIFLHEIEYSNSNDVGFED